ncbi:MAG: hypothetical protein GXY01_04950 [Clostridiales bacterium]|nr:hypothetical protein [Clostridiales bacterium]
MKTKFIPLILTASVCFGLLTGCQSSELSSYTEDKAKESSVPATSDNTQTVKDYTPAYESYDPDEVMLTVNGIEVTWGELFYWYVYDVSTVENYFGEITDWDAQCGFDPNKTNRDYVIGNALDTVKHYCAVESKARDMGVALTDEDKETLKTNWDNNVQSYGNGDEAAFIEYLKKAYLSKEMYDHINEVSLLYDRMLDNMFGANGEKISEKDVLEKGSEMGYVRVKHILISSMDENNEKLSDDKLTEKKASAENLLKELKGISDKAALEKRLDEMISEYGNDPGTEFFKDGYTFIPGSGTMNADFENAVTKLGDYELSEIVETNFGYHIILRLPLSSSAVIDSNNKTLSYYAAQDMFSAETEDWADESSVKFAKAYEKMDIEAVFNRAKTEPAENK